MDYDTDNAINQALSTQIDLFLKETVLPQVKAVLETPNVVAQIEKRVASILEDSLEETDPYDTRLSPIERLVDHCIDQTIEGVVFDLMGKYLGLTKVAGSRTKELDIKSRLQQLAKSAVEEKLSKFPAQLDALIAEFVQDVQKGKIPAGHKRELKNSFFDVLLKVAVRRFYAVLGHQKKDD